MVLLHRTALLALVLVILIAVLTSTTSQAKSLLSRWKKFKWPLNQIFKPKKIPTTKNYVNPEADMTSVEIISNRGYPVQIYSVTTDDGYILEIHRIPHGKGMPVDSSTPHGRPVYLQHGFTSTDADWLISPSDRSLAFRLADLGYDVWLGNIRGNKYSRRHTTLDPSSEAFWEFSWDEMGRYDVPAIINYILVTTSRTKLIYIGHSMGCAVFFVAMITHPELNDKIEVMVALAPATSLDHMTSPIRYFAPFVGPLETYFRMIQTRVFLDNDDLVTRLQSRYCPQADRHVTALCKNLAFALVDDNLINIDPELWPVMDSHTPAGTSLRTAVQFAQNFNSGETFIPYSYGWIQNLRRYGQLTPPPYELSRVTAPVYIFYGALDTLVHPKDAVWLSKQISNLKEIIEVDQSVYNHFDFLWATDNNRLLYDLVIARLPSAL